MASCSICNKETPAGAKFCPACGKIISSEQITEKWYFKTASLVVSFLCVGPFMLPLVWYHPKLSKRTKVIYTVIILLLSYMIYIVFMRSLNSIFDAYKLAGAM